MSAGSVRRFAALAGSAIIAATVVACSTTKEDKPVEAPATPASSAPAPAPTNKNVTPGMGGNSFSPSVTARPAPTALPGNVVTGG